MTHTFYIVRHGNTFDPGETVTRVGGRTDLKLSTSGLTQAENLARHLASTKFDHCIASPLQRTWKTAEMILAAQPDPPNIQAHESLREIDYGPDENQPEDLVRARIGEAALELWESQAKLPDGWSLDIDALKSAWHDLFAAPTKTGNTLIVTSNGIARFALLLQANAAGHDLKLKTGAYGIIHRNRAGQTQIVDWNLRPPALS